jgi:hypothetical protein
VAAIQGAIANAWDGRGMQGVLQRTQQIIEELNGPRAADDGAQADRIGLSIIRGVLEQCHRQQAR